MMNLIPGPSLYDTLANSHPSIARGQVWCTECGRSQRVDPAAALAGKAGGWPKCCGLTMTIDSPGERAALRETASPQTDA